MRRLLVSNSELNCFRSCRNKHRLKYIVGWSPQRATAAQNRGSAGHAGMESMYKAIRDQGLTRRDELTERAIHGVGAWCDEATQAGQELEEGMYFQMTEAMIRYIDRYVLSDIDQGWRVRDVEKPFVVPLENASGRSPEHVWHGSVLDLTLENEEELVLVEHKFTDGDCSTFDARFDVDPQMPGYIYDLRKALPKLGLRLGRVFLNVIRRTAPRQPNINKVTKKDNQLRYDGLAELEATGNGNQGKVSVAACDTTRRIYLAALEVQKDQREIPITIEQLNFAETLPVVEDRWLCRHEWFYSPEALLRWQLDSHADASLIRQVHAGRLRASRNGSHCFPQNAFPCEVREMCVNEMEEPSDPENWDRLDQSYDARLQRLRDQE